jgi:hypothetical protein
MLVVLVRVRGVILSDVREDGMQLAMRARMRIMVAGVQGVVTVAKEVIIQQQKSLLAV